jgi:hypothetical protein
MKRATFICLFVAGLLGCLIGYPLISLQNTRTARLQWKEEAISAIASLSDNPSWIDGEIRLLKDSSSSHDDRVLAEPWLSDRMILMESGEWLVYQSHCHKVPPHNVTDICLARGTNGKWYYTTCHFCVRMVALIALQGGQPKNLQSFLQKYQFREFDVLTNQ